MRSAPAFIAALAAVMLIPSTASAVTCRAPIHTAEITSAKGLTCRAALSDLSHYDGPFAPSFRTPGGYTCAITARRSSTDTAFRCRSGSRSYRFDAFGRLPHAIRVSAPHYDAVFKVTSCRGSDPLELSLKGYSSTGFTVEIANGKLFIDGGDEQDSLDLEGTVAASSVSGNGTITASGIWTAGGLSGGYRLTGDCR